MIRKIKDRRTPAEETERYSAMHNERTMIRVYSVDDRAETSHKYVELKSGEIWEVDIITAGMMQNAAEKVLDDALKLDAAMND